MEPAAKRRRAKLQTEAQGVSRFDVPVVTSAAGMKRSGHGRKGERADQGPASEMKAALVTAVKGSVHAANENTSLVVPGSLMKRLDRRV